MAKRRCKDCGLWEHSTQEVGGKGNIKAKILILGEGPGKDEDAEGIPFIGKAGGVLDKMLDFMKLALADVYITNTVRCRPPGNRTPHIDEMRTCANKFLIEIIKTMNPSFIILLGNAPAELFAQSLSFKPIRGKEFEWKGYRCMQIYHPAALLYQPVQDKIKAQRFYMKKIMQVLEDL